MILTYILILSALLHFYWALGGKFGLDYALPTDAKGNRLLNPSTFMSYVVYATSKVVNFMINE